MKRESEYTIKEFSNSIDQNLLNQIFTINQENTPEVGSLSSIQELSNLINLSSINYYVSFQGDVIAFILCFKENSRYKSKNYKYFSNIETKFLYVDRVAVKDTFRHKGLGKKLYFLIESIANEKNIPICCEINTLPPNEISLRFHKSLGFYQIGQYDFKDHSVAYYKKFTQ